jgi:2-polyprenyl-3-methyl-5-hydroxy-6-metoxy-1,4-benzoquinol methylase
MLPLPDAIVDEFAGRLSLIVCSSVIEYVERDLEVLHQCRRMLRPGGTLLMSFPNGRSLYWIAHRVMRHTPVFAGKGSRHQVHQYTERQIRRAAGGVGLSVLELRYFALPLQRVLRLDTDTRPKSLATLVVARMVPAT